MRTGDFDEQELEQQLDARGFMNRFYGRATRAVSKPWQMYPLGVLFGLGFDTATEVALLVPGRRRRGRGLPFYAILCLPILFAAGMSLLDTIDGAFMNFAYGWAFSKPVRKIYYNITITGLSVAVALIVGTIELLSVLADRLEPRRRRMGLRLQPRPQPRRLLHRRAVRAHLGGRARGLALRPRSRNAGRRTCSSHEPTRADDASRPAHPPLAVRSLDDAARVVRDAGGRLTGAAPRRARGAARRPTAR